MRLKRRHKKQLAFAAIGLGLVLFGIGAYLKGTLPAEPPMSQADWFEVSSDRMDREFHGYILMGLGAFMLFAAVQELIRQAKKLKT